MHVPVLARYSRLAGHPGLAEAAAGSGYAIPFTYLLQHRFIIVRSTALLVMAEACYRPHRAAADAGAAAAVAAEEAVFGVMLIASRAGRNDQVGDDAAAAMSDAPFADEASIETEGAKTGSKGGMPFRPGGRRAFCSFQRMPVFRQEWCERQLSSIYEEACQVPSQVIVEGFSMGAGVSPLPGRPKIFSPVALTGSFGDREYPADDRTGSEPFPGKGGFHQFPWCQVMWTDNFLIVTEQRVRGSGEPHQWFVKVADSGVREAVGGAFRGKTADLVPQVFFQGCFFVHAYSP